MRALSKNLDEEKFLISFEGLVNLFVMLRVHSFLREETCSSLTHLSNLPIMRA